MGATDLPKSHGKCRLLVNVDGPLGAMQAFWAGLPIRARHYLQTHRGTSPVAARVISATVRLNQKGIDAITGFVYSSSRKFAAAGVKVKLRTLAVPPSVLAAARSKKLNRRERESVRTVASCVRRWLSGRLTAKEVLILADQAAEDWLRCRTTGVAPSSNFPELTRVAAKQGVLTAGEATRLRRFHASRTKSQHRGKVASTSTARSMLTFLLQALESKYVDPHNPQEAVTPAEFLAELKAATQVDGAEQIAELQKHLEDQGG